MTESPNPHDLPGPHDPADPQHLLARIAALSPSPESTRRVLARVTAALPATQPAHHFRWILPASIAAAVLVALTILLALLPGKASAQESLAVTLQANADYKGWVHLAYSGGSAIHWDTQTGAYAGQWPGVAAAPRTPGRAARAYFRDPAAHINYDYNAATGIIQLGALRPDFQADAGSSTPLSFPSLIEKLRAIAGQNAVRITESQDRGLDRFDIVITKPALPRLSDVFDEGAGSLGRPTTVWVDPQTKLIRTAAVDGNEINLTYGAPEMHSIYDAGAPREAKIVDNRPSPETLAVVNRLLARAEKPMPDGVAFRLTTRVSAQGNSTADLRVYGRTGKAWTTREYRVAGGNETSPGGVRLPERWPEMPAEELLGCLPGVMPAFAVSGDGTRAWEAQYDPLTGEAYITWASQKVVDGKSVSASGKVLGQQESTGREARGLERNYALPQDLYPRELNAAFSTDNHLDLLTAADRPGQVAIHVLFPDDAPNTLRSISQEWFEPDHDDRPVTFQQLTFINAASRQVRYKQVVEFSGYQRFPAPDNRSYPTAWVETTSNARGDVEDTTVTALRFLAGARLPEIPSRPSPH